MTVTVPTTAAAILGVRYWRYVQPAPSGCWIWTGFVNHRGYGQFRPQRTKMVRAHRWAYEHLVGPIPEGLTIDHLCRVKVCVNPLHMEPVTRGLNALRGNGPAARNARKNRCIRGHEFTPENTYVTRKGQRYCRECRRLDDRKPTRRAAQRVSRHAREAIARSLASPTDRDG